MEIERETQCRCMFPTLTSHQSMEKQTALVVLEQDEEGLLHTFRSMASDNISDLYRLLQVSWALVLVKYTGSQTVSFGVIPCGSGDHRVIEQKEAVIDSRRPISDAVQLKSVRKWGISETALHELVNTCLVLKDVRGSPSCPWVDIFTTRDITIVMDNSPSNLQIWMQYCTSVLNKEQARNVLTTLIATLQCLLQYPLQSLQESELISQRQRDQIKKWNSRASTEPLDLCIHTVFRLQFMIQPDAQALCAWDGSFSYHDLDVLSSKVQSRLMTEYGIGAGCIIPLLFEKSKWTVVGILGILKAGAGFVLLDPAFPERRLQEICTDVNAKVMVCSVNKSDVPWFEKKIVVGDCVRHWKDELQPAPSTSSQGVAYIVYTSGSTGQPKGVIIQHGSFCTNAIATSRAQNLDSSSRVLQFASYAFDVSIHESLTALMLGGCVCIPSESLRINSLTEAITGLQVNWAELTPSVARTLHPKDIPTVKTLVLGGESISSDDIDKWKDHLRLICAYGPSECTVVATVQSHVREPQNIGHSFAGTCWIVDKDNHHCLVSIGAIGELVIGGLIVGQGYLNRPEQTAAAFIRNPRWASAFGMKNTQVFYKTGDLVRYASDGTIVYVGRKDTQVKLNGQRIELGDIESHARRLFKDAHITAEIASLPGKRPFLVLFLAPKLQIFDGAEVQGLLCEPADGFQEEVQYSIAQLRHALPGYMVPTVYIPLKAMPVSRTGKVSRKLLRTAVTHLSEIQLKPYRPSFPPVVNQSMKGSNQEVLRQLFASVLDLPVDIIGLHDGFFELGGDSISSIVLVGKAKEQGIDITVGSVFTHQSITKLAENIHRISVCGDLLIPAFSLLGLSTEKDDAIRCAVEQCRIHRSQVEDIYPCTALQEAMMTCTINHPGSFQATFRFQLPWSTDIAHFKQAWRKVSDANPILRTRIIQADAQRLLQVVVKNEDLHWDLISKDGEYADPIMSLGTRLVCFHISDKPKNNSRLSFILTMHHCVFDGWSYMRILEAVEAACRGLDVPRREFTPFINYISALEINQAKEFWNTEFRDLRAVAFPAPAPFPGYIPRSVTTANCRIKLPKWPRGSYTPSAIITFAFSMLASWHTGSNDVVVGVIVTGRSAPLAGVDQMTGPTIATLPFRTVLQPGARVNECLGEVQDHFTSLIPFEQVGMRRIRGFSAEAAAACEFQGLLVIQAPAKAKYSELFFQAPKSLEEEWRFNMHLLTCVCELSSDSVLTVKALVDEDFVGQDKTQMFLQQFEYLLCKAIDLPDARVDTIIPLRIPQPLCQIPLRSFPDSPLLDPDQLRIPLPKLSYPSLQCFMDSEVEEPPYRRSIHQKMYRSIVAHVLGIEVKDIDIDSDFFALGGDSTSAMQATMLCRNAGLSLDAADIYNLRKIGLIASRLKPLASSEIPSNDDVAELNTRFSLLPPTPQERMRTIQTEMKAKLGITEMEYVEDAYPLTAVHRGLLHTQLLDVSDHQSYTIWDVMIEGCSNPVDPFRLRDAWSSIVHRHPALRTILLGSTPDTMAHVVLKASPLDIQILSCKDEDALPLLRSSYLQDDTTGSPYMFTICRTNSGRVLCKLEGSHAFLDATSVLISLRELAQTYNGKHPPTNGPLYSSAVRYFRDPRSVNLESISNYWKKQLAEVKPCIVPSISPDTTHPPKKNIHTTTLSLADTTALKQFCASNGFTIGNIFEVAWGLILQWQTGSENICFGSLVSGRNVPIPEVHNMIGPFFNVHVCRICLNQQSSMLDTLRKNQIEMGNRLLNQHCPLIDCLRLSDHFGRRLFNTCLSIEQQLSYTQAENGICFQELETLESTEYGLFVTIIITKTIARARLTYWTSVLTDEKAVRLLEQFRLFVSGIINNRDINNGSGPLGWELDGC